ncbi:hypothetical protein LCGC14_0839700, partial [marine sediment metagenome]
PKGNPTGPRDYRDRIGAIRSVTVRPGEGLFADFHFNPKHALAEQLAWDAQHAPQNVGFSHNVQAQTARRGREVDVEALTKVQSVDLVADPATTRGLFESEARHDDTPPAGKPTSKLCVDDLRREHAELVESLCREQTARIEQLQAEIERLTARETAHQKQRLIRQVLREFHLPDPDAADGRDQSIVSERFLQSLLAAENEGAIRELVEERAALVRGLRGVDLSRTSNDGKPSSRDQHSLEEFGSDDTKAFVDAIT